MNWKIILAFGAILLFGTLYAQTPDGETPANEGVCDDLMIATPGLYGLCIAYCEAQDLDTLDPDDPTTLAKTTAKVKILDNYNKRMNVGDPPMPCVQTPVPCWTEDELDVVGTNNDPGFRTVRHQVYNCPGGRYGVGETWYIEEQGQGSQIWAGAWYKYETGQQGCWFEDDFNNIVTRSFLLESMDDYYQAVDSILAQAEELGWTGIWETHWPEDGPCQ